MKTKVSIIMPIYNVEKYLQQSLLSVCNQSLKEIEIVCINDGSSDSSLKILNYFAQKDSRIKVISTNNSGYGHAMNIGIEISSGEYVGIVEPDDYVNRYMFEYLYDAAKLNEVDIVKSDFKRFKTPLNSEMNILYQSVVDRQSDYNRVIIPKDNKEIFRYIVNIWCGIYRRELIVSNNIKFNESRGASFQDNGFWFQTLCNCNGIYYVQIPFYMNRRDNVTSSVNRQENIYAGNYEFKFIYDIMSNSPKIKENFLEGYHIKKYQTYKFNLNRCTENMEKDYIEYISNEWREDIEKGELTKGIFKNDEWQEILQIVNDPIQYVNEKKVNAMEQAVQTEKKYKQLEFELEQIRKSFSYKLGLFLTKIPRKIKESREKWDDR